MTKSARQLVNLCQLARSLKMTKSLRQLANLPPTGQPLPTAQPHRRQLARFLKMTKSLRQLVNLIAANWRTSLPPTGEPAPSCSEISKCQITKSVRQLASWARRGNATAACGPGKRPPPSPTVHTLPLQAPGAAGHVDGEVCC